MGFHPDSPLVIADKLPDFNPRRHAGEGRNPVVYASHSRAGGNDNHRNGNPARHPIKPAIPSLPGIVLLAVLLRPAIIRHPLADQDQAQDALRGVGEMRP